MCNKKILFVCNRVFYIWRNTTPWRNFATLHMLLYPKVPLIFYDVRNGKVNLAKGKGKVSHRSPLCITKISQPKPTNLSSFCVPHFSVSVGCPIPNRPTQYWTGEYSIYHPIWHQNGTRVIRHIAIHIQSFSRGSNSGSEKLLMSQVVYMV